MQHSLSAAAPALWLLPILGVLAVLSLCSYEGGSATGTYVQAEIISYSRRSTGKSAPDPGFYAQLPSGLRVYVRDLGELPATFRGR